MTVAELIELLQKMPQEMTVMAVGGGWETEPADVQTVEISVEPWPSHPAATEVVMIS